MAGSLPSLLRRFPWLEFQHTELFLNGDGQLMHPHWTHFGPLHKLPLEETEQALLRAVAQRPIRFTRVLLGGELDPGGVEYLPGMVNDVEAVRASNRWSNARSSGAASWPHTSAIPRRISRIPDGRRFRIRLPGPQGLHRPCPAGRSGKADRQRPGGLRRPAGRISRIHSWRVSGWRKESPSRFCS